MKGTIVYIAIFLLILVSKCENLRQDDFRLSKSILPLLGDSSKNRLIFLLTKEKNSPNNYERSQEVTASLEYMDSTSSEVEADVNFPDDEAAYLLLHMLRTKPDNPDDIILQETKDILRQGLRTRCRKVDKCVQKCPPKKPKCPKKCKKELDDLDFCRPNKQCKKPKCGRTMPPKWLLRFNN